MHPLLPMPSAQTASAKSKPAAPPDAPSRDRSHRDFESRMEEQERRDRHMDTEAGPAASNPADQRPRQTKRSDDEAKAGQGTQRRSEAREATSAERQGDQTVARAGAADPDHAAPASDKAMAEAGEGGLQLADTAADTTAQTDPTDDGDGASTGRKAEAGAEPNAQAHATSTAAAKSNGLNPIEAVIRKTMASGWSARSLADPAATKANGTTGGAQAVMAGAVAKGPVTRAQAEATPAAQSAENPAGFARRSQDWRLAARDLPMQPQSTATATANTAAASGLKPEATLGLTTPQASDRAWISPRARHMADWTARGEPQAGAATAPTPGDQTAKPAATSPNLALGTTMAAQMTSQLHGVTALRGQEPGHAVSLGEAVEMRGGAPGEYSTAGVTPQDGRAPVETFAARSMPSPGAAIPRQIGNAMATAMSTTSGGDIELQLHPEELGKLRMRMSIGDGVITISLAAERAETADMMRRNIAILSEELSRQGFSEVAFSFEQSAGGDGEAQDGTTGSGANTSNTNDDEAVDPRIDAPVLHRIAMQPDGGLDVRL